MRINWPGEPGGNSKGANWLRQLLRACKKLEIVPGPGHRIRPKGSGGFDIENVERPKGGSASEARLAFRGSYDSGATYQRGDIVQTAYLDETALTGPYHFWVWWSDAQPTGNPDAQWAAGTSSTGFSNAIGMNDDYGWIPLARIPTLGSPFLNGAPTADLLPPTVTVEVTTPTGTNTLYFREGILVGSDASP